MYQKIIAIVLALFIVGCATQKYNVVDPAGRKLPNPHYVLNGIGNDISVMFYYMEVSEVRDIDGTSLKTPSFIPLHEKKIFTWEEDHSLFLVTEVHNPKKVKYSVYEKWQIKYWSFDLRTDGFYHKIAESQAQFRRYQIRLPYVEDGIREVRHHLEIRVGDGEIPSMMIGDFVYQVKKKGGEQTN
jgi:hypothetical protein